jgi:hypothetical protein
MIFSTKSIIVVVLALCAIALSSVKAQETGRILKARRGLKKEKAEKKNTKKSKSTKNNPKMGTVQAKTIFTLQMPQEDDLSNNVAAILTQAIVDAAVQIGSGAPPSLRRNRNLLNVDTAIGEIDVAIISKSCEVLGAYRICALEVLLNIFMDGINSADAFNISTLLRAAFDQGTFEGTVETIAGANANFPNTYQVNVETENVVTQLVTSDPTSAPTAAPTMSAYPSVASA